MREVSVIGLDLAKQLFQLHGVDAHGRVVLRRRLRRSQMEGFFASLPPCLVGVESCPGAHHWARVLARLGHRVRIMPAAYVRPYRKRGKNDASDAEAICEAVQRPNMRFVAVKTPEQQGVLALHRARALLVRQQVALVNQMRAVLAEQGVVFGRGRRVALRGVAQLLGEAEAAAALPEAVRAVLQALVEAHEALEGQVRALEAALQAWHQGCEASRRLATIPGIGPLTATARVGGRAGRPLPLGAAPVGLAGAGARPAQLGRASPARAHQQARQPLPAPAAGAGRAGAAAPGAPAHGRRPAERAALGRAAAAPAPAQCGRRGAGQQARPPGLGSAASRRALAAPAGRGGDRHLTRPCDCASG